MWRRLSMIAVLGCAALIFGQAIEPQDAYSRAAAAFDSRNYADAAALALSAEHQQSGKTEALLLRAKALIHLDQYPEAEQSLRDYLGVHDRSGDATYLLAYVLFRRNLASKSLEIYTAASRLQPPTGDDFKIVGLDYVLLNDYPDAIHWLERAVAEQPNEAETLYDLGRAYYVQNNFDQAIAMFTRALTIDPRSLKAKNNLGLAFEAKNELDQAASCYREAIEIGQQTGKESDQPYINLGQWLSRKNRWPEALQMVEKAEQIGGKSERAEELRGKILLAQDRLSESEQAFREALALDAKNGSLHYELGRVLRREGKEQEAARQFEQTKTLLETQAPKTQ